MKPQIKTTTTWHSVDAGEVPNDKSLLFLSRVKGQCFLDYTYYPDCFPNIKKDIIAWAEIDAQKLVKEFEE
jgi:hypothetical protein